MKLVKLSTDTEPVFINPEHVVSVRKGMKDTAVQTVSTAYTVKEPVDLVLRLLGADEARDITPNLQALPKSIDL